MQLPREIQVMIIEQMVAEHFDGDGMNIFWSGGPQHIYSLISTDPKKIDTIKILDTVLLYATLFPSKTVAEFREEEIHVTMFGNTDILYLGNDLFLRELAEKVKKEVDYYLLYKKSSCVSS